MDLASFSIGLRSVYAEVLKTAIHRRWSHRATKKSGGSEEDSAKRQRADRTKRRTRAKKVRRVKKARRRRHGGALKVHRSGGHSEDES